MGYWTLTEPDQHHFEWSGERVLYHVASGETHYLNPLAVHVVQRLSQSPATLSALLGYLEERGSPGDALLQDRVRQLLDRFVALGIADVIECSNAP